MLKVVFLFAFVVLGGEMIYAVLPASPQNHRDFSNIITPNRVHAQPSFAANQKPV